MTSRDRALLAAPHALRRPPSPARAGLPPAAIHPPTCPTSGPGAGAPTHLAKAGRAPARHPERPEGGPMDHPTLPPISLRVTAGAALLDHTRPGWAAQVDPDRLDLADDHSDVLGQLHGHSDRGLAALGDPDPVALGFDLDADDDDGDYPALAACWRAAIARRRPSGQPAPASPPGPLDHEPAGAFLSEAQRRALLTQALAGVELGAHDRRILAWLAGWEPATVRTVASLLRRARLAGREGSR